VAELAEEISSGRTPLSSTKVHIQGPYGRLSIRIEDYHHILLVGGGIGVTPLTSTLEVIKQKSLQGRMPQLKMVELVWVVRSVEQLSWFAEYLGTLLASFITTTSTTNSNGGEKTPKARAYNDNARGLEMVEVKEDAQHRPSSSLQPPPWVMLMNVTFQVGTYLPTDLLTSTSSEWFVCSRIDCQSCTAQINQPVCDHLLSHSNKLMMSHNQYLPSYLPSCLGLPCGCLLGQAVCHFSQTTRSDRMWYSL